MLAAAALAAVAITIAPRLNAADAVKPRVRAITGFVTIDAKNYRAQIEETVAFLGRVREAVVAAGYEVAGIRISTQPFPAVSQRRHWKA